MKRLLLLRHAEAESAVGDARDFDRPLSERGRGEALAAAGCIARTGLSIDAALISPSLRTRQTLDLVASTQQIGRLIYEAALYLGGAEVLLQCLQRCDERFGTIVLVGHNPGISELAQQLAWQSPPKPLRTAGLCCIALSQRSWNEVDGTSSGAVSVLR
jgi:phosphohistidine phosphatase